MVSTAQKESSGDGEMAPSVKCWPQTEVSFSDCAGEAMTAAPGSSEAAQPALTGKLQIQVTEPDSKTRAAREERHTKVSLWLPYTPTYARAGTPPLASIFKEKQ